LIFKGLLSVQCSSWYWTDIKSLECMSVCTFVYPHKRFVHDSEHNICPIFHKFGTWVRYLTSTTNLGGQVAWVKPLFYSPETAFRENLQLKPIDNVSAYFLTTDKAIVTKVDRNIKQVEICANCKIWG